MATIAHRPGSKPGWWPPRRECSVQNRSASALTVSERPRWVWKARLAGRGIMRHMSYIRYVRRRTLGRTGTGTKIEAHEGLRKRGDGEHLSLAYGIGNGISGRRPHVDPNRCFPRAGTSPKPSTGRQWGRKRESATCCSSTRELFCRLIGKKSVACRPEDGTRGTPSFLPKSVCSTLPAMRRTRTSTNM